MKNESKTNNEAKTTDETVETEVKSSKKNAPSKPPIVETKEIKISLREYCNSLGTSGIHKFAPETLVEHKGELNTREEWEAIYLNLIK